MCGIRLCLMCFISYDEGWLINWFCCSGVLRLVMIVVSGCGCVVMCLVSVCVEVLLVIEFSSVFSVGLLVNWLCSVVR